MATLVRQDKSYRISLLGDIVLARLIDQLLPVHVEDSESALHVSHFRQRHSYLASDTYNHKSPWGNTLPLLQKSDLVLGNLETSVTTHPTPWPDKVFNYRMHPTNIRCLTEAGMDYVSLANNHSLDFGEEGLEETVQTVKQAGIACAGATRKGEDINRPAVLRLEDSSDADKKHEIHLYSFSDHPHEWSAIAHFSYMEYNDAFRGRANKILNQTHDGLASKPSLKIVSCHWGPNYRWQPDPDIVSMAHFLIDECGVDIIHGHSSHHIQGVEVYKGKLIIYGCGDFVDDYAVTPGYRNDLSAVWNVAVDDDGSGQLRPTRLEVYPTRIKHFQTKLLPAEADDHKWVRMKLEELCKLFNTEMTFFSGPNSHLMVNISG